MTVWTLPEILLVCRRIETICPAFGCHVALTGGLLYKEGPRKDADLVFYRIRQIEEIDVVGLFAAFAKIGIKVEIDVDELQRWSYKATLMGKAIDLFFPEAAGGEYPSTIDPPLADPDDIFV